MHDVPSVLYICTQNVLKHILIFLYDNCPQTDFRIGLSYKQNCEKSQGVWVISHFSVHLFSADFVKSVWKPKCFFLFQYPLIPSMRSVRGKNRRSSGVTQKTVSTQTVASAFTTGTESSPWTWSPTMQRRCAPGSRGSSTWWPGSAMKTVWPADSALGINILYPRLHANGAVINSWDPVVFSDWALTAVAHGCSRPSPRLTKMEMVPWALGKFTSCSISLMSICPSRKSRTCFKWEHLHHFLNTYKHS